MYTTRSRCAMMVFTPPPPALFTDIWIFQVRVIVLLKRADGTAPACDVSRERPNEQIKTAIKAGQRFMRFLCLPDGVHFNDLERLAARLSNPMMHCVEVPMSVAGQNAKYWH